MPDVKTSSGDARRRNGGVLITVVAVLSVVVLLLVLTSSVLYLRVHNLRGEEAVREQLLSAARTQALNTVSLDYRQIDKDLDRLSAGATGDLRKDLDDRRVKSRADIVKAKAISTGRIVDAALVELKGDNGTALIIVDNTLTNETASASRTNRYRFQLDLTRSGDRWLANNLVSIGLGA